jgi:heptosyltransferase-1
MGENVLIKIEKDSPKIALIKLGSIGDCLHMLPLVSLLKNIFPKAYIVWFVEEKSKEILFNQAGIDEIIIVNAMEMRQLFKKRKWGPLFSEMKGFRKRLSDFKFDLAIDGQGLIKSGLITYLTGAPIRIGYSHEFCREKLNMCFTTHRIKPLGDYVVEQTLSLVRDVKGLNGEPKNFEQSKYLHFILSPEDKERVSKWLQKVGLGDRRNLIALHPGAGFQTKRWPLERFLELGELLEIRKGLSILFTPGEMLNELEQLLLYRKKAPMVVPPLSLNELAALYQKCRVVVAGDTGPLHLAGAVGCSTVGLFGPSDGKRSAPLGEQHRNIQRTCFCRGNSRYFPRQCRIDKWCMAEINVEEVYSMVVELLNE